jgi:hypothetical protein
MAVLLGPGFAQHIRDARSAVDATTQLYVDQDPAYGLQREFSTNLNSASTTAGANVIKGFVVYKPNLHVRIRKDVTLKVSNQATVDVSAALDGSSLHNLWQQNETGVLYETRLGFFVHDINRAVVAIIDAASRVSATAPAPRPTRQARSTSSTSTRPRGRSTARRPTPGGAPPRR